jgi:hypothetical protein
MPENEPGRVIALAAQPQQILIQALRPIEFGAGRVMARLPIRDLKELRGGAQALP